MQVINKLKQLKLAQPVAIIGAGLTGKSCFDLLSQAEISCHIFDEKPQLSDIVSQLAENISIGKFSREIFGRYKTILMSPGVDWRRDCFTTHEDKILTDIELFARLTDKPIIGVTGSNGKSSVVTMIDLVLKQARKDYQLCGNIGLPVLQALLEHDAQVEGYVIELSSYHLESAPSLRLAIGVLINISPDHLDRYASFADYAKTKARIFEQSDYCVANADDDLVRKYAEKQSSLSYFSRQKNNLEAPHLYLDQGEIKCGNSRLFAMADFPLVGLHHAENIMAVFAVANKLGIDVDTVAKACQQFEGLANRMVLVGEKNGVMFINDSKGTNVGATVTAISGIAQPIILIAGGQGKGQDFTPLAEMAKDKLKAAVLIGEAAAEIGAKLEAVTTCVYCDSLVLAFEQSVKLAGTGEVVMLSPACASFDMFTSYIKRGSLFEQQVKEWING